MYLWWPKICNLLTWNLKKNSGFQPHLHNCFSSHMPWRLWTYCIGLSCSCLILPQSLQPLSRHNRQCQCWVVVVRIIKDLTELMKWLLKINLFLFWKLECKHRISLASLPSLTNKQNSNNKNQPKPSHMSFHVILYFEIADQWVLRCMF